MKKRLLAASVILRYISTIALFISAIGMMAMTIIVGYQVFARFILNNSPSWTEGTSILIMSWFIFLGAAVGVREKFHMGFDVLLYFLPQSATPWLRSLSDLAILIFGLGMFHYGLQLTVQTWSARVPVLGIPTGVTYLPIVVSGFLICLFILERIALRFAGEPVDQISINSEVAE
ncbi:TRAP transporter small permease [Falsochrobactrum ovis]|uniref:TRAP transporter small permease protein n=1 Tax=Falsochrobactrum ovis TaxID=1293442 RepID=A0A364JSG0_9HYPH|nr:TRAP transporter small permease [Falsochrobactrum ovis]RAK26097.1 TRAP-type C4-dicarboxylate transport system permease small subunit [Falsochrobactrum ovis]